MALRLLLCLGLAAPLTAAATAPPERQPVQTSTHLPADSTVRAPHVLLKWSPLTFLEFDAGLQLGVEYALGQRTSLQHEAAHLFYMMHEDETFGKIYPLQGFALKTELRRYLGSNATRMSGFYLAPQVQYKHTRWDKDYIKKSDGARVPVEFWKHIVKTNLRLGYQLITPKGFVLDVYGGAGIRLGKVYSDPDFYVDGEVKYGYPINLQAGVKVGWAL